MSILRCTFAALGYLFLIAAAGFAQEQITPGTRDTVAALRREAAAALADADAQAIHATRYRQLASDARTYAGHASDPRVRLSWMKRTQAHHTDARRSEIAVERLRAQAEEKSARAARLEQAYNAKYPPPPPQPTKTATKPADAGDDLKAFGLQLEDAIAHWTAVTDPAFAFVILPEKGNEALTSYRLEAHTKRRVWKGRFTGPTPGDAPPEAPDARMIFTYTPRADEMNPEIPAWARAQVAGKLVWRIEIEESGEGEDFDPLLLAKWFPGDVRWSEEGERRAWLAGDGEPEKFTLEPNYGVRLEELSQATLALRLETEAYYDPDANPIEALTRHQAVFVRVTLPVEAARKQGGSLTVVLEGPDGKVSDSVELMALAAVGSRPVRYETRRPIVVGDCNWVTEPAHNPQFLSVAWMLSPLVGTGTCLSVRFKNGENVTFSYDDAFISLPAYDSWVQRELARHEEAVTGLKFALEGAAAGNHAQEVKDAARKRLLMLSNYQAISKSPKLTDLHRFFLGELYFGDTIGPALILMPDEHVAIRHRQAQDELPPRTDVNYFNPLMQAYLEGLTGSELKPKAHTAAAASGVFWTSEAEQFFVRRKLRETSEPVLQNAVKAWGEEAAFGALAFYAVAGAGPVMMVEDLVLVATDRDHRGKRVKGWDKVFAAIRLGSNAVLSLTGTAVLQTLNRANAVRSRLGRLSKTRATLLANGRAGASQLMGHGVIPNLPASVSPRQAEQLLLHTLDDAGEVAEQVGSVGCALRGEPAAQRSLGVGASAEHLGEVPLKAGARRYISTHYRNKVEVIGSLDDPPILPMQSADLRTCNAMAANYLIWKGTSEVIDEAQAVKTMVGIYLEQAREAAKVVLSKAAAGKKRRGLVIRSREVLKRNPGYQAGFDELGVRDYLRMKGAKVIECAIRTNPKVRLRHAWAALKLGYGVKMTIKFRHLSKGEKHARHAVVIERIETINRNGRQMMTHVVFYDSNVGKLMRMPAKEFDALIDRGFEWGGVLTLVKFG